MSAVFSRVPHFATPSLSRKRAFAPVVLRLLLIAACAAAAAVAWRLGDPAAALQADPELARLLRGMAAIKGLMVVAAMAIVLWRFGHPIGPRVATSYVIGTSLLAAATALVWQLTVLLPAAAAFHAGLFLLLIVAWRGDSDLRTSMG